ncbi:hypothetical protein FJY71_02010 [candidate division WOR-3 bacterium]|nr:hypothetical protein [candidate division WOR-3 bacterium]
MKKRRDRPVSPAAVLPGPVRPAVPPLVRVICALFGTLLLATAIHANRFAGANTPTGLLFADHYPPYRGQPLVFFRSPETAEHATTFFDYLAQSTVFARVPGMPTGQYRFFPLSWLLLGLALPLLGAGLLSRRLRQAIAAPWRRLETALPLAGTLAYLVFTLVPWDYITAKPYETGTALVLYIALATAGFVLLVTGVYPLLRFFDRPARGFYDWLVRLDRRTFMLVTAGFTFLVANVISLFVFEHMPHIQDSISQLFQARIFATGRLSIPSPPFADFFDYTHIINNGQWYSQYPFLHSLFLMLGVFIGAPWLINPLFGALTVPVIYLLGRELYEERIGRLAAALACFTPFIFNLSAEFMNHSSTLFFTCLFLLFFFRTIREPGAVGREPGTANGAPPLAARCSALAAPLLAGLFLGLVVNIRPYTAAALALPFGCYGLWLSARRPGRYLGRFAVMLIALGAVSSLLFVYNWLTNGDPMLFGYVVKWGPGHEVGFGKSGWGPQHTPLKGLLNTGNDHNLLNKFLFEWPLPALLPIAVLFAAGTRDRRDWLLLAMFLSLTWAHFFYWFHNVCFGPRFLYESAGALLLLTVRGFLGLGPLLRRTFRADVSDAATATLAGRVIPLMLVFMLGAGLPPLFRLYHTYGGVSRQVQRAVNRLGLTNALVFCAHLGNGFSANSLDLDGDVVYAKDYGPLINAALTLRYPDRRYFYASGDTVRPIDHIRFPESQLAATFGRLTFFLADSITLHTYRSIIWPFADRPPPIRDSAGRLPPVVDYRQISREIFAGRKTLDDYLPAVAVWLLGDAREHLKIFSDMNRPQNFITDRFKFTLLRITPEGEAAVYDIRPATGREITVPD